MFCGKFGSCNADVKKYAKRQEMFFVISHITHLHQVYFLAFFARISCFKFLEFNEVNKVIIPFAIVGYETGYSQLGATRLVSYLLVPRPRPWARVIKCVGFFCIIFSLLENEQTAQ